MRQVDPFDLNPTPLSPQETDRILDLLSAELDGGVVKRDPLFEQELSLHILATIDFTMYRVKERLEKIVSSQDPLDRLDQLDQYLGEITRGLS